MIYGKFMKKMCSKAPGNYSAPYWSYNFSICSWENLNLLISMISGFWDVSPSPKRQLYLSLETQYLKRYDKNPQSFLKIFL